MKGRDNLIKAIFRNIYMLALHKSIFYFIDIIWKYERIYQNLSSKFYKSREFKIWTLAQISRAFPKGFCMNYQQIFQMPLRHYVKSHCSLSLKIRFLTKVPAPYPRNYWLTLLLTLNRTDGSSNMKTINLKHEKAKQILKLQKYGNLV